MNESLNVNHGYNKSYIGISNQLFNEDAFKLQLKNNVLEDVESHHFKVFSKTKEVSRCDFIKKLNEGINGDLNKFYQ